MDDEPPPLSLEEKNSLYMKAVIPFAVVLVAFFVYFYYRMETSRFVSTFDFLFEWALPFFIAETLSMMLTVEVFYHLKVRKPFGFHAKRFAMNVLLLSVLISTFFAVAVSVDVLLSPHVGEERSMIIALVSWSMLVAAITIKFQRTIRKYWKEP